MEVTTDIIGVYYSPWLYKWFQLGAMCTYMTNPKAMVNGIKYVNSHTKFDEIQKHVVKYCAGSHPLYLSIVK